MNVSQIIDDLIGRFGPGGLERIDECLQILSGRAKPGFLHPEQEATRIFFPGISAEPWHRRDKFAWVPEIERRWPEILREFEGLQSAKLNFSPYEDQHTGDIGWTGWDTWHLYRAGEPRDSVRKICPRTLECIEMSSCSGLREGFFSVLTPGTEVKAHTGGVNLLLTVHLPLIVPRDCEFVVCGEKLPWTPGEILIFDDSFIHEAWNHGPTSEVMLIWDIWHPELTAREIEVLTYLYPKLEHFLARS